MTTDGGKWALAWVVAFLFAYGLLFLTYVAVTA